MDRTQQPHRRYNALTGDWILVSPHRTQRPWQGKQESFQAKALPSHDPQCYLCSGNARAGGEKNPVYYRHLCIHQRLRRDGSDGHAAGK